MKKILLFFLVFFLYSIISYGQAGRLDSSFGNKGIVVSTPISSIMRLNSFGKKALIQNDGNFYLILEAIFPRDQKTRTVISHFLASGSIDSSFGNYGYSNPVDIQNSTGVLDNDGKIVIVGSTLNISENNVFAVARYNKNGTLDSTFSEDGELIMEFGDFGGHANSVAIQKDGRIVVAGTAYNPNSNNDFTLARLNLNGTLDSTFSKDGKLTTDFGHSEEANSVAIQSNGKIVAAGYTSFSIGNNNFSYFALARYNTDGTLDTTFSRDGKQTTDFGVLYESANSVAIQRDGKIVAAGIAFFDFAFARYNTNGTLDTTFSEDGKLTTDFASDYDNAASIAIQSDGKIVAAGEVVDEFASGFVNFGLVRYNTDGTLDPAFGNNGKVSTDFGSADIANFVGIQNDGKILAVGSKQDNSASPGSNFAIARYNTDGTLDKTFSSDGKQTGNVSSSYIIDASYETIAVQTDGKIVAGGTTVNRYNTDGSLDSTFRVDSIQAAAFGDVTSLALQSNGKIVVAGGKGNPGNFALARYNADGTLDSTFHLDSTQNPNLFYASSIAIQTDGKIVVAGSSENGNRNLALARYNSDGTLDSTFSGDGMITDFEVYEESEAQSVKIQSDGKLVVNNYFDTTDPGADDDTGHDDIARFNPDGSIDSTFGTAGRSKDFGYIDAYAIQDDGKIILSFSSSFLVRLNNDGTLDTTFKNNGTSSVSIRSIAIESDGKIIGAGGGVVRCNSDGSLDSAFGENGITTSPFYINNIAIDANKLYAAGAIARGSGHAGAIARYLLDNNTNTPPTVTLTTPVNNATRLAPAAHIKLGATASDTDGSITKVEFYNGNTLLHTETVAPYGFVWRNVPVGNYTLTAKAYDNSGLSTTSAPVHISVVPNKPPVVSIVKPKNNQAFAAPGYIHLEADAKDTDGRITRVEFYNGSTLLNIQYQYPYTFVWKDVPAGTYTITAVATDNWGAHTTSAPVVFRVIQTETKIVSNKPSSINSKTSIDEAVSIRLLPNPAKSILNIYITGLQQNKAQSLSVISSSGQVVKTIQSGNSTSAIQIDVSSLVNGVYTVRVIGGKKIFHKQFVKL